MTPTQTSCTVFGGELILNCQMTIDLHWLTPPNFEMTFFAGKNRRNPIQHRLTTTRFDVMWFGIAGMTILNGSCFSYCWWFWNPKQPVEVGSFIPLFSGFDHHPRSLALGFLIHLQYHISLVRGFNPFEKHSSNWSISPKDRGRNKSCQTSKFSTAPAIGVLQFPSRAARKARSQVTDWQRSMHTEET